MLIYIHSYPEHFSIDILTLFLSDNMALVRRVIVQRSITIASTEAYTFSIRLWCCGPTYQVGYGLNFW